MTIARLLRRPPVARFFAAYAQSAIGNGVGYVALLLLAYETFHSAWAVSAILLADFLPSMLAGPLLGAVVDRLPRRTCIVVADLLGAAAFGALVFAESFPLVIALALLAGVSGALSSTALMAGLPEVVEDAELPAATSLYGVLEEAGVVAGPLLGALALAGGTSLLLALNAVSFVVSAALITTVRFRSAVPQASQEDAPSLLRDTITGLRELRDLAGARALVLTSTVAVLFFGALNVAELLFAKEELGAGPATFSLLVAAMSIGMTAGALAAGRYAEGGAWRRHYLLGLALMGLAMLALAQAHELTLVIASLVVCGYGNGLAITNERLLLQHVVASHLHGRVFGIRRALVSWAFCGSYLGAGAVAGLIGARGLIAVGGVGMLIAFALGCRALRGGWVQRRALTPATIGA